MCWFLTIAISARAEPSLPAPARAPELRVEPQENRAIMRALSEVARLPNQLRLWSITRGGCSCDLIRSQQTSASDGTDAYAIREDVRSLLARLVEETRQPLAFVIHTYGGALDEGFEMVKGPRMTPGELRASDCHVPADALCVVREVPRF